MLKVQRPTDDGQKRYTNYQYDSIGNVVAVARHDKTWHTLNNKIAINDFVDVLCQEVVSLGAFIPIEIAKVVIENFFENPFSLSNETKWIETTRIDWDKLKGENY